jgi:hypothetical protein
MEQKKENKPEAVAAGSMDITNGKSLLSGIVIPGMDDEDSLGSFDFTQERQDLVKRREDTQKKMAEIEKLFFDIDREDSLKAAQNGGMPPVRVQPDSDATK